MVRISIPHYGTTEQVDVPRVSRKNSVSLPDCTVSFCRLFLHHNHQYRHQSSLSSSTHISFHHSCNACRGTHSHAPSAAPFQMLLVVAALALCVALSMFVADKYLTNTGYALESNSSDEDNIECV